MLNHCIAAWDLDIAIYKGALVPQRQASENQNNYLQAPIAYETNMPTHTKALYTVQLYCVGWLLL